MLNVEDCKPTSYSMASKQRKILNSFSLDSHIWSYVVYVVLVLVLVLDSLMSFIVIDFFASNFKFVSFKCLQRVRLVSRIFLALVLFPLAKTYHSIQILGAFCCACNWLFRASNSTNFANM